MSFDWASIPTWVTQLIYFVVGSVVGAIITYRFSLKAQRRNIRAQYIINNIEKTYVPIVKEIQRIVDNYQNFFGQFLTFGHYTIATSDKEDYQFNHIRNEGYFEIVKSYNLKLANLIIHFYDNVVPRLRETEVMNREVDNEIIQAWDKYLHERYGNREDIRDLARQILQENKHALYNNPDSRWRVPSYEIEKAILDECKGELIEIAKPGMQKLYDKHGQGLEVLKNEQVDKLIDALRRTIGNPI